MVFVKHPNGYGSVFKLSGNRRKPWAVRVTTGWTDEGKQQYTYLGYYKTRPEAILELARYNDNPYDLDINRITFGELYNSFLDSRKEISNSLLRRFEMSYNLSKPLHNKRFATIKTSQLQKTIDKTNKSHSTKTAMRSLYNQMYNYALSNDLAQRNYAQFIKITNDSRTSRSPFTKDEIDLLWSHAGEYDIIDAILVMIYTGMRPGEIVGIETSNVFIDDRYLIAGSKTEAGKDRIIPIHKKIVPIINKRLNNSNKILSFFAGGPMGYATLLNRFKDLMDDLNMDHRPHDCRHTFATLMDNAGANKLSIKVIMGHSVQDITDGTYTHKDVEELIKAVDLLE